MSKERKINNDFRDYASIEMENVVFSLDMIHAYMNRVHNIQVMFTNEQDQDLDSILEHENFPGTQVVVNPDLENIQSVIKDLDPFTDYVIFHFL